MTPDRVKSPKAGTLTSLTLQPQVADKKSSIMPRKLMFTNDQEPAIRVSQVLQALIGRQGDMGSSCVIRLP